MRSRNSYAALLALLTVALTPKLERSLIQGGTVAGTNDLSK